MIMKNKTFFIIKIHVCYKVKDWKGCNVHYNIYNEIK